LVVDSDEEIAVRWKEEGELQNVYNVPERTGTTEARKEGV
jgi:hypothetical protein